MANIFEALAAGNANFQYAFHIYGMPYCLCSGKTIAADINGSASLKSKIFGTGHPSSGHHYDSCVAIAGAIDIPGVQSISLDDTDPIPSGGDWQIDVYDRDYGINFQAAPFYFPSNLKGLPGIQCIGEINNQSVITVPVISVVRKTDTSLTIIDPEGLIDERVTAYGATYLWIGSECVYTETVSAGSNTDEWDVSLDVVENSRGVFRSQAQSHFGAIDSRGMGTMASTVPIGSIGGLGCALWLAHYESDGTREATLYKYRHGRVKSRTSAKNGVISIQCAHWMDWLKTSMPVSRGDLRLAKYVFTRADEPSRMYDLAWQVDNSILQSAHTQYRIPHLGVMIAGAGTPNDVDFYDLWLCDENSYVVFDTVDDVLEAVSEELSKCWDGDTTQHSGDGSAESPYIHWNNTTNSSNLYSNIWRPIVAGGRLDVVEQVSTSTHNVRFYGIIPWLFGLGPIQDDSKDFATYWMAHLGPSQCWLTDVSAGTNERKHFVYPYSVLTDGYSSYDTFNNDSTDGAISMPEWTCSYYYDANQTTDWREVEDAYNLYREQKAYALTIPKQTIGGNPRYRIYTQPGFDPRILDDGEQVSFDCERRLSGEWGGIRTLVGTVQDGQDPSVDSDGYGIIDLEAHDWGTWQSAHPVDTSVPAIVIPMVSSEPDAWRYNQWSSIFYCPGSAQDESELFGGDPFIARVQAGGWFDVFSTPLKSMLGSYGTGTPVSSFVAIDFIPDCDGSDDQPASIDWTSLDSVVNPIISGHVYHLDIQGPIDISKLLSQELVLHGVSSTWELDPDEHAYIMRFRPYSLVNGSEAILSGAEIDRSTIAAGEPPELTVNDAYRYNKLAIKCNKQFGSYLLPITIENPTAKSRMGRTSAKELTCELSFFKTIADMSVSAADMEELTSRLQDTLYHISRDYPQLEIRLTAKSLAAAHLGADMLLTDPRIRDPYSGSLGLTRKGVRVNKVSVNLQKLSMTIQCSLIGNPVYGWAPAAYSPGGNSYFYDDSGTERLLWKTPTAQKNYFSESGTRKDLHYFVDWSYNRQTDEFSVLSDTDYAVAIVRRRQPGIAVQTGTVDASSIQITNGDEGNCATIVVNGLDHTDFNTTEIGGDYIVEDDLIMIFDQPDSCEEEQLIYATFAREDGTIDPPSMIPETGTRWQ